MSWVIEDWVAAVVDGGLCVGRRAACADGIGMSAGNKMRRREKVSEVDGSCL